MVLHLQLARLSRQNPIDVDCRTLGNRYLGSGIRSLGWLRWTRRWTRRPWWMGWYVTAPTLTLYILVANSTSQDKTAPVHGVPPTTAPGPNGRRAPTGAPHPGLPGGTAARVQRVTGRAGRLGHGARMRHGRLGRRVRLARRRLAR